jgi:hypothetical protein
LVTQPAFAQQKPVKVAAAAAKPATPRPAAQPQLPPPEAMIILIRSSLVALSHANLTNNYTVLNGLGSAAFHVANSPFQLAQRFETLMRQPDRHESGRLSDTATDAAALNGERKNAADRLLSKRPDAGQL